MYDGANAPCLDADPGFNALVHVQHNGLVASHVVGLAAITMQAV